MKTEAVAFIWDGAVMVPLDRYRSLASRQFRPGQEYSLIPHRGRSEESHSHYFACLKKAWENLPHDIAPRFPTQEHLRKWCLIKEGFADEHSIVYPSEGAAQSSASLARSLDGYAVIRASGQILTVWSAKSQDRHHMNHEEFQNSKTKVLERLANMIGISVEELTKHAGKES